jgi:hypothetical protein
MSSTDIQLYGNNAKSTLLLAIGPTDTVFSVVSGQGSRFPTIASAKEFFLITFESAGLIEVCKVISRIGDSFTVERSQEGTIANSFPIGAQVQMRVTKDTLARMARLTDRLGDIDTVDNLPAVSTATGNSFLCTSADDGGNPIMATKGVDRWRFPTHSVVAVATVSSGSTTTSITSAGFNSLPVATGRYILNFLTGPFAGQSRLITAIVGTTLSWSLPTSSAPANGTQVELLVSNAYQISLLSALSDESIINAIIFGS